MHRLLPLALLCCVCSPAQTRAEKEQFLKSAGIVAARRAGSGITGSLRATLDDGKRQHDAHVQTYDEYQTNFRTAHGVMLNFKDSWKYNVAAYKMDQLLGLNMCPVAVEREYKGKTGSFMWWVDDVVLNEEARLKSGQRPPDPVAYSHQVYIVRVFDELIYNFDRNLGNLLIDKDWQIWMIDHSRSFYPDKELRRPENVVRCDRKMLERMAGLNEALLQKELEPYATKDEIRALLARRDRIVALLAAKGPDALFESPRRP
jgi:hypothetical protein